MKTKFLISGVLVIFLMLGFLQGCKDCGQCKSKKSEKELKAIADSLNRLKIHALGTTEPSLPKQFYKPYISMNYQVIPFNRQTQQSEWDSAHVFLWVEAGKKLVLPSNNLATFETYDNTVLEVYHEVVTGDSTSHKDSLYQFYEMVPRIHIQQNLLFVEIEIHQDTQQGPIKGKAIVNHGDIDNPKQKP